MFIKQLYTGCLSEAAYYIESDGIGAIIDPLRDIEEYLALAAERKAKIKYIFETHFHADFVSGHLDLATATGATIVYGPDAITTLPVKVAKDGERFDIGKVKIEALHTPGHTLESSCFLLIDENGKDHAVFTGDTLFIGDVGRPDLAQKANEITTNDLAGMMYESLQKKIVVLNDEVIVYPGHGAGSSCGKNLGPETQSTIGEQKKTNYALLAKTKEAFIKVVTEGLTAPPQYFPINARINKEGYESLDTILQKALKPLTIAAFRARAEEDEVIILDTRISGVFTQGYVPGSVSIGLDGRFAEWAGSILPFDKTIILVTEPGKERETIIRLARVGYEKIEGYLEGGYEAWLAAGEKFDMIVDVEADELAMDIPFDPKLVIVDVRKTNEFAGGHITDAINIPVSEMMDPASMVNLEDSHNIYVHCAGGYRSVIACSLIKRQGIHNIYNVLGGWTRMQEMKEKFTIEKTTEVLN